MTNAITVLADKLSERFGMVADGEILGVLKATAFRGEKEITDAQMTALLVVANQYGLNPWTKEIYAFPDKRGGIVPVVGVDGWSRIINDHPQFDGMDFEMRDGEVTCVIYRKDRSHPTRVTEYLVECQRKTDPWTTHPRRMLRHKAMIQCARLAFGFVGIYDRDEAERIIEGGEVIDAATGVIRNARESATAARPAIEHYPQERFDANFAEWSRVISSGRKTADDLIAMLSTKGSLSDSQKAKLRSVSAATDASPIHGEPIAEAQQ